MSIYIFHENIPFKKIVPKTKNLENEKRYRRSAGVNTNGFLRAIQIFKKKIDLRISAATL